MNMMHRLLSYVNNVWSTQAKEQPAIRLRKHNGYHAFVTVHANQLHLHTLKYSEALPVKQSIVLDDLTIEELKSVLEGMGYGVDVLEDKHLDTSAMTLIPQQNTTLDTDVHVFTSDVWRMLYPIANLLEMVKGDVDKAIQQMFLRSSSGKWLDYWASFFALKRYIGETDGALIKRIILFLINPKTNNRSIEELMKLVLGMEVEVTDAEPSVFDVFMEADGMSATEDSDKLLNQIKAGGVHFIYNYRKRLNEDYNGYVYDVYGKPITQLDNGAPYVETTMEMDETDYRSQMLDILGWLVETPSEVFKEVLEVLEGEGGGEYRLTEEGYRQVRALIDQYDDLAVAFAELKHEVVNELDGNLDIGYIEESMFGRIYEHVDLPLYELLYAEITTPRSEDTFTLLELAERHREIELQNDNVLDLGYAETEVFYARLTEYVFPFSNEMWVFDEYQTIQVIQGMLTFMPLFDGQEPRYQLVDISDFITSEVLHNEPSMYAKILEVQEVFHMEREFTDTPRARQENATVITEFSFEDMQGTEFVKGFTTNESLLNGTDRLIPTSEEKKSPKISGYMVLMDSSGNTIDTLTMN